MKTEYVNTIAEVISVACGHCNEYISDCLDCGDMFEDQDEIFCSGLNHLCQSCYDGRKE